jgi:hypothetical protein
MADDVDLPLDKVAAAIERLEREKQRRAGPAVPEVPTAVERVIVDALSNAIIRSEKPVAPPSPAEPRPRNKKPRMRVTPPMAPVPFFTVLSNPLPGTDGVGEVSEAYFVTSGKQLALCGADGNPSGDWHPIHERGELYTARQALRQKLAAARGPGPDHRPIQYRKTGWM